MHHFEDFIGIDYSGAKTATSRLKGLRVFHASIDLEPIEVRTEVNERWHWTRKEIAEWLVSQINSDKVCIVGLDHGFSFPESYFYRYEIRDWTHFLDDFVEHWPLHEPHEFVDRIRDDGVVRIGTPDELRLSEKWTSSAKSVFRFDVQGQVAKSTHTGIPWLLHLKEQCGERIHFWPFDGWLIPEGKSVVAEVYPSLFSKRYPRNDRTADQQDAYATATWLAECSRIGRLQNYLEPSLTEEEKRIALLEGWILGVA